LKNKEFFIISPYSSADKKSPISDYNFSEEMDYDNSLNGDPLYKILKFIKK